jgi:hypothetical protein
MKKTMFMVIMLIVVCVAVFAKFDNQWINITTGADTCIVNDTVNVWIDHTDPYMSSILDGNLVFGFIYYIFAGDTAQFTIDCYGYSLGQKVATIDQQFLSITAADTDSTFYWYPLQDSLAWIIEHSDSVLFEIKSTSGGGDTLQVELYINNCNTILERR